MSANPSSKWFWNDWDNDRELQLCGLAAQGLWMRMLSIAARASGYVRVGRVQCSPEDIATIVGQPIEVIRPLLAELEMRRVFSRSRDGTIYNRRMLKDAKRSKINAKNGKMGGNPNLLKQTIKSHSVKPPSTASVETTLVPLKSLSPLTPIPKEKEERTDAVASVEVRAGRAANPRSRANGKSPLPDDWSPDERDCQYAASKGYGETWIAGQSEQFRDHHLKLDTRFADWHAAWRTWVQRAPDFDRGLARVNGSGLRPTVRSGPITDAVAAIRAHRNMG